MASHECGSLLNCSHLNMNIVAFGNFLRKLAVGAYLLSLMLPPFKTIDPDAQQLGLSILLTGWGALLDWEIHAWLANPLAIYCFFRMKSKPYLCAILGIWAIFLAQDFDKVKTLGWDSGGEMYSGTVVGINIGCYVWLSSLVVTFLASVTYVYASRKLA
jgi:hypothetical protein